MKLRKILKSTAVIVTPPTVRIVPTLLRSVASVTPTQPKAGAVPQ